MFLFASQVTLRKKKKTFATMHTEANLGLLLQKKIVTNIEHNTRTI